MYGYSHRKSRRAARMNPEEASLLKEVGMTVAASVVGVALSVGIEKLIDGMKKGGEGADKNLAKYSSKQVSAITAGIGAVLGVGLHVKGIAPRVGKALIAGSGALSASRYIATRGEAPDLTDAEIARITGGAPPANTAPTGRFHGIDVAPVMISQGTAYGYLPSGAAVGAQYGTVASGADDGAQYGTVASGGAVGAQYGTVYTG